MSDRIDPMAGWFERNTSLLDVPKTRITEPKSVESFSGQPRSGSIEIRRINAISFLPDTNANVYTKNAGSGGASRLQSGITGTASSFYFFPIADLQHGAKFFQLSLRSFKSTHADPTNLLHYVYMYRFDVSGSQEVIYQVESTSNNAIKTDTTNSVLSAGREVVNLASYYYALELQFRQNGYSANDIQSYWIEYQFISPAITTQGS